MSEDNDILESWEKAMGYAMVKRTDDDMMKYTPDPKRAGEAMELFTVSSEQIMGFNFELEKDLRRRKLVARMIVFMSEEPEVIFTPEAWQLRKVPQGLAIAEDLSRTPLHNDHARYMCNQLANVGIRPDTWDERDLRIKDLKERIKFLEAVIVKNLGITKEDLRLIRDE